MCTLWLPVTTLSGDNLAGGFEPDQSLYPAMTRKQCTCMKSPEKQ